jgi:polyisoprenyl-teichoic acid--peptidoglycan teichoic acid transferase
MKTINKKRKTIIIIALLFIILFLVPAFFLYSKLAKIKIGGLDQTPAALGIDNNNFNDAIKDTVKDPANIEKDFVNILIMGIDAMKEVNDSYSADSIMVATIDKYNKKLKLTSIMRDSLVTVEGYGDTKLKYAYSFGGPQLLVKTVNQNFNMNIKNYVKVDFFDVEKIIDYLGGVQINVEAAEINILNDYQKNISSLEGKSYTPIKKSGLQTLNGMQAVAYSRIRYVGNYDFERTERQRRVMTEVLKKFSDKNALELAGVADKLLPLVETSLGKSEIIGLGSYIVLNKLTKPIQFRVPTDKTYHDYTNPKDGLYYMKWDKQPTIDALHSFIFEAQD